MDTYILATTMLGLALLTAAWIPEVLTDRPLSLPVVYVVFGFIIFTLPLNLPTPNPFEYGVFAERLTQLVVIISLTGAGLKLERPIGWARWGSTWRLLVIAMPLCIAGVAFLGWWMVGLAPAAAALLGAVLAPTDPVLAADVQANPPGEGDDEVRFALTSEAGLNDGLAFPFTNLAIAMVTLGAAPREWLGEWLLDDVLYKIVVGTIIGILIGRALAYLMFRFFKRVHLKPDSAGLLAIAITLLAYGVAEMIHAYGFMAVFAAACALRQYERRHEYHEAVHNLSEQSERLLMVLVLVLFGGAVASGLLASLTWPAVALGLIFLLLVRPAAAAISLLGTGERWRDRAVISFFGIRGIGSLYYLAHAFNIAEFPNENILWSTTGFVMLVSIFLHGTLASPVMKYLDERRTPEEQAALEAEAAA